MLSNWDNSVVTQLTIEHSPGRVKRSISLGIKKTELLRRIPPQRTGNSVK